MRGQLLTHAFPRCSPEMTVRSEGIKLSGHYMKGSTAGGSYAM